MVRLLRGDARRGVSVAVIGAGIQGCCAALALAERGARVTVYERESGPMERASRWNEGKIHLGYIFAKDVPERTARLMTEGALAFGRLIRRWTGQAIPVSSPFRYVVHRDSLVSASMLRHTYGQIAAQVADAQAAGVGDYLGQTAADTAAELPPSAWGTAFDPDQVQAVFQTDERSVDPARVATSLVGAIQASPRINLRCSRPISRLAPVGDRVVVTSLDLAGGQEQQRFDHVVNASWDGRPALDAQVGMHATRPWSWRYKVAVHAGAGSLPSHVGSTSLVLGEYGDVVRFPGGAGYLSWYPICRLSLEHGLAPDAQVESQVESLGQDFVDHVVKHLQTVLPDLSLAEDANVMLDGGWIFASGTTDVSDPASGVHQRSDIGVRSDGQYHSISTGKYTTAPLFAEQVAERILPCR